MHAMAPAFVGNLIICAATARLDRRPRHRRYGEHDKAVHMQRSRHPRPRGHVQCQIDGNTRAW